MSNKLNISIFSKALYSSWCYAPTYQTLFDCGEGCATHLANRLPGIENLFFGHLHGDHTLGLPSLLGCRNNAHGTSRNEDTMDHNKSLTVYYPEDNDMSDLIEFCNKRYNHWLRYDLKYIPVSAGFELQVGHNTYVRAFNMKHQKGKTTLGYVIYENRTRLKKEFQGQDIRALIKSGVDRTTLNETYRANTFAYCLDSYDITDKQELIGCENIIMDCTFISPGDRTDMTHYTFDEAVSFCKDIGAKNMFAAHLSGRYNFNEISCRTEATFINPFKVNEL
jgi:ribonuclease Z